MSNEEYDISEENLVREIKPDKWTTDNLMKQDFTVPETQASKVFGLKTERVKATFKKIEEDGENPYELMGLSRRQGGKRLHIHMPIFRNAKKNAREYWDYLFGKDDFEIKKFKTKGKKITLDEFMNQEPGFYRMQGMLHVIPLIKKDWYALLKDLREGPGGEKLLKDEGIFKSNRRFYIKLPDFYPFFKRLFPKKKKPKKS